MRCSDRRIDRLCITCCLSLLIFTRWECGARSSLRGLSADRGANIVLFEFYDEEELADERQDYGPPAGPAREPA